MTTWTSLFCLKFRGGASVAAFGDAVAEEGRASPLWLLAVNAEKLIAMRENRSLLEAFAQADVWYPDGMFAVLVARVMRMPTTRLPGVEVGAHLLSWAAKHSRRVMVIGGAPGVSRQVSTIAEFANADHCVVRDGFQAPSELLKDAFEEVERNGDVDLIAVAMGSPRQELFLAQLRDSARRGVLIGLGGSFDVYVGMKPRAPAWMGDAGLEWLFQVLKQPARYRRVFRFARLPLVLWDAIRHSIQLKDAGVEPSRSESRP